MEAGIANCQRSPDAETQDLPTLAEKCQVADASGKRALTALGGATESPVAAARICRCKTPNPWTRTIHGQNAQGGEEIANRQARVDTSNATAERVNSDLGGVGEQPPADVGDAAIAERRALQLNPRAGFTKEQIEAGLEEPSGPGTYKPPSASSSQQQSLPEQLGDQH